jgi:hypothetical protein
MGRNKGQLPLARSSCAKIKNIMSVLFNHARRYELFDEIPSISFGRAPSAAGYRSSFLSMKSGSF